MKAQDLRIGNWMHFDNMLGFSYDYQVTPRMFCNLSLSSSSDNIDVDLNGYHQPIPLTEEWLVKAGFVKQPWGFSKNGVLIVGKEGGFHVKLGNGKIIKLPFVHTLQNFYSLTGEELTFKEF